MLYKLIAEKTENNKAVRVYRNDRTGTEVKTEHIFTDKEGKKYFGFSDLFKIPYIRSVYAKHINDLYGLGLSLKDLLAWCAKEKELLRSEDSEKYEKLYAMVLEKERIVQHSADPIRQHLALCTVYVLSEDEPVDFFSESVAEDKLTAWQHDIEAVTFFLNWHHEHMQRYTALLKKSLKTVSKVASKLPDQ